MLLSITRSAGRLLLALAVLLPAACVPVPNGGGAPQGAGATATPAPTAEISIDAAPTAEFAPAGVTSATVDGSLLITPVQTVTLTTPISPDHSIVGPVGEPQMHGAPVGNPTTGEGGN